MPRLQVKVKLAGGAVAALRRRIDAIDRRAGTKAVKAGINEITKAVLRDAKEMTPVRTGQLRKSLGRRIKVYRNSRVVVGIVGPRTGFKILVDGKPVNPAKYAHLVEYGRAAVRVKNRKVLSSLKTAVPPDQPGVFGPTVAAVPPRPFLRPAWDAQKVRAKWVLMRHLSNALRELHRGMRARAA